MHQAADAVTCISSVLVKRARTLGRPDVYLIPNGINVRLMEDAASQKKVPGRILFVGRLERMKGVETLLDAFAILAPKHQQLQLRVVGGGSLRYALEQRCSKLLERGRIAFLGQCSLEDTRKEYAEAEYFCALSRSEALGNVFLEAQVAGCAVVATNVGGIPDIVIHGKTGLLVPPDDPVSAAQALERLMQDSALQNRLCENGKLHAAQYDWSRIAEEYGSLYGKILRPSSPMS
jgi:glycosyltransferase involved in cell wall biosynthesis